MLPLLKNPCTTFGVADLKQIDCWELLQQKDGFIQDQQRNATGSLQPMEVPERGPLLQKGKGSWEDLANKESVAFHWLNPRQERRVCLLSVGLYYPPRVWELPNSVSQLYFTETSVY